jgi:hypothetical protein
MEGHFDKMRGTTMLEGSLIIEGAAWRVRALRLMELDIDRFSTVPTDYAPRATF